MKRKTKQFQYEIQQYQEDCVSNIVNIFEELNENNDFVDVLQEHNEKNNYNFPVQDSKNIDIMMETGTGKTFTFIKTIFELNRNFGYNKFIVLIPSVAIREGTKTNLEDTRDYFKSFYANEREKQIETYVYEGGNFSAVKSFVKSPSLSVLIMTPSAFNSKDNILNRTLDENAYSSDLFYIKDFSPKTHLDALKGIRPIVIMDEPHRFEGDAFKEYFKGFENYYLRFGATFPQRKGSLLLSNVAYVLDSISSFRQNLVKKIVVYTQDITENTDTLIGIENKKAIVQTVVNDVVLKRELGVGRLFNGKSIKKINKDAIVLVDDSIEKVEYALSEASLRRMIAQTISIHFKKEQELFEKGIKALTLFFMESDKSLFRGDNPIVKNIFEEEYLKQRQEIIKKQDKTSAYYQYLLQDFDANGSLQVHEGYFSGDKGTIDDKIRAGVDEILRDKKKLLSFESPTRFIFSIWALQEGWDNPNVFTICKLSNQGSEISKLQQIGRGLRLAVNQELKRQTMASLGDNQEEFWKINNLDVIVSSKEQGFVEGIQNEILNNSYLVADTFTQTELTKILQRKTDFGDNIIVFLVDDVLIGNKLIIRKTIVEGERVYEKSPHFSQLLKEQDITEEQKNVLRNLFSSDIKNYVSGSEKQGKKKKIFIKPTHLVAFKELWEAISKQHSFTIKDLDKEEEMRLVQNIAREIERLEVFEMVLKTTKQTIEVENLSKDNATTPISEVIKAEKQTHQLDLLAMVHHLSKKTKTPLSFVIKIVNALSGDFKKQVLTLNPKQVQQEMEKIITENLLETMKTSIRYNQMNHNMLLNVFHTEGEKVYLSKGSVGKFQKTIDKDFSLKAQWVFEEVIEYDSDFELDIIEKDPRIPEIEIFGKLPKLEIKTPLGKYSPDFCYTIKWENAQKVYLVVEAKGYDNESDIPRDELYKIDFGRKYFEMLNELYKDKNIKISFQKRIKKTDLQALIMAEKQ